MEGPKILKFSLEATGKDNNEISIDVMNRASRQRHAAQCEIKGYHRDLNESFVA
jgi:hypothetical protein